jgi:hypothetical protein
MKRKGVRNGYAFVQQQMVLTPFLSGAASVGLRLKVNPDPVLLEKYSKSSGHIHHLQTSVCAQTAQKCSLMSPTPPRSHTTKNASNNVLVLRRSAVEGVSSAWEMIKDDADGIYS